MDLSKPSIIPLKSPIYQLPDDILLDILLLVLRDTTASQRDKCLGELMLVCPQWKALSDTPSLWAHVSSYQSLSAMKKSLSKSKGALLDIVYTSYASELESEWSKRMETNDLFLKSVHRWRSFEFRGSAQVSRRGMRLDAVFMDCLRCVTAPNLDSISLRSPVSVSFRRLFVTKPDRLRHISLKGCLIPWDSGLFSGLETLELYASEKGEHSLNGFIQFLQVSPGLVKLSIENWKPEWDLRPLSNEPIILLSLETLKMCRVTNHIAEHLLAIIRIPKCAKFHLTQHSRYPESTLFGPPMEHLFPMLRTIMASCNYTRIRLWDLDLFVTSGNKVEEMLKIESTRAWSLSDWTNATTKGLWNLFDSTAATSSVDLTIRTDVRRTSLSTVFRLMESSCHIKKLKLVQHNVIPSNQIGVILELLSKPTTIGGVAKWPLSSLRILEIIQHGRVTQDGLVDMVRNRYTDREPRETYELPAKLQTLRIEGRAEVKFSQLETMKGILGPGIVEYVPPQPEPVTHHYDSDEWQDD
ncbi:hypothetical protein FRB95_002251 [Tulasnella sp. JGI-2019a]|nr:hypothetical protein FRB95_002251 [Tulasnella sp. JGI-2019a]